MLQEFRTPPKRCFLTQKKGEKKRENMHKKRCRGVSKPSQTSQKELFAISPVPDLFFNKIAG